MALQLPRRQSMGGRRSTDALIGPHHEAGSKLVIVMVGLPASGKSYIAKKLCRYLNWLQHRTQVFNVGDRRRVASSSDGGLASEEKKRPAPPRPSFSTTDATFFDPTSSECVSFRDQLAINTLEELLDWLEVGGGNIGILDATNSTSSRRELLLSHIAQRCAESPKLSKTLRILFLESRCSDPRIREANIRLKLSGPDYAGKDPESSLADFRRRVAHYEKAYQPLGKAEEEKGLSFVSMTDAGRKMNTHLIRGFVASQTVEYLLNFNLARRQIWVSCTGESEDEIKGRIGRFSNLSPRGQKYAGALANFIDEQRRAWLQNEANHHHHNHVGADQTATTGTEARTSLDGDGGVNGEAEDASEDEDETDNAYGNAKGEPSEYCVWTSTWPQAMQTGCFFPKDVFDMTHTKMLDDLNAGKMAGLTVEEITTQHPLEYAARKRDKLLYRWPGLGGEGYVDLIVRLRPLIVELERTTDHLVLITHRAVVRVLITYFLGIQRDDLGEIQLPKDTVYCFDIEPYGISLRPFTYRPETGTFNQIPNSDLPFVSSS
ncbi:bifunctional 6-phosphofructo-2-kinase/fructose-2,6-bisphosphate 2-phosphatase [Xylariaceae sp. FL0594]|nr:bifunctional 6-phosphofructo-2-kinase/fructose-2,6-bisphosphate 2-phosphatase [Xylariaceae sp. FL0594]